MPVWLIALVAWLVALPVVTVCCIAVMRGGQLEDAARARTFDRPDEDLERERRVA
jgi:hypothetical protein